MYIHIYIICKISLLYGTITFSTISCDQFFTQKCFRSFLKWRFPLFNKTISLEILLVSAYVFPNLIYVCYFCFI